MADKDEDQVSSHGNFGETSQSKKSAVVDHKPDTQRKETPKKTTKRKKNRVRLNPDAHQKP